ncbi:TRCF domain-containing protein, partial [Streptococcus suis]
KRKKNIDSRVNYQQMQEEMIDRFGDYPEVVAYFLEIGILKSFLYQVFFNTVLRRQHQVTVKFEPISFQILITQDYFEAL